MLLQLQNKVISNNLHSPLKRKENFKLLHPVVCYGIGPRVTTSLYFKFYTTFLNIQSSHENMFCSFAGAHTHYKENVNVNDRLQKFSIINPILVI